MGIGLTSHYPAIFLLSAVPVKKSQPAGLFRPRLSDVSPEMKLLPSCG